MLQQKQIAIIETWKIRALKRECSVDRRLFSVPKHAHNKTYCSARCRLKAQHESQKRQRALTRRLRNPDTANRFILNSINGCSECKSKNIIYDFERREIVCGDCGLVIDMIKY